MLTFFGMVIYVAISKGSSGELKGPAPPPNRSKAYEFCSSPAPLLNVTLNCNSFITIHGAGPLFYTVSNMDWANPKGSKEFCLKCLETLPSPKPQMLNVWCIFLHLPPKLPSHAGK